MRELEADLQEAEDELDARDAAQERAQAMSELLEAASTHRGGGSSAGDPSRPGTGRSGGEDAQRAFSLVRNGRHREVQELFDAGRLFPDTRDAFGNTVLIVACQNNRKRIAKAAVKHGVPLNAQNGQGGHTALHYCFEYGYTELAEFLIRKGADEYATNTAGFHTRQGLTGGKV